MTRRALPRLAPSTVAAASVVASALALLCTGLAWLLAPPSSGGLTTPAHGAMPLFLARAALALLLVAAVATITALVAALLMSRDVLRRRELLLPVGAVVASGLLSAFAMAALNSLYNP